MGNKSISGKEAKFDLVRGGIDALSGVNEKYIQR